MIVNGITYDATTSEAVIRVLERVRAERIRIRLHYGDTETGRDWMDTHGVEGVVGNSMGPIKIPILVHNERSAGGLGILDRCIVRIRYANRAEGGDLYRHPTYHLDLEAIADWTDQDEMIRRHFA